MANVRFHLKRFCWTVLTTQLFQFLSCRYWTGFGWAVNFFLFASKPVCASFFGRGFAQHIWITESLLLRHVQVLLCCLRQEKEENVTNACCQRKKHFQSHSCRFDWLLGNTIANQFWKTLVCFFCFFFCFNFFNFCTRTLHTMSARRCVRRTYRASDSSCWRRERDSCEKEPVWRISYNFCICTIKSHLYRFTQSTAWNRCDGGAKTRKNRAMQEVKIFGASLIYSFFQKNEISSWPTTRVNASATGEELDSV